MAFSIRDLMRPASVLCLALLGFVLSGCDSGDPAGFDFTKEDGEGELGVWVHSGRYNRKYFLHTPPGMSGAQRYPLLIFLHGGGEDGEAFHRRLRADATTDAAGFITVYPSGMEDTWTVGCGQCTLAEALEADDVSFITTLIRHLADRLPVDTTRVYVAGFAQGGQLAQLYGCQSDMPPAGIAGVAAAMFSVVSRECQPRGAFPVAIVHGDRDPFALYGGYGIRASILSTSRTVDTWVRMMTCDSVPVLGERPDTARDGTWVTTYRFDGCAEGAAVVHFRVHNGGHTWPGDTGPWSVFNGTNSRNLDTTAEILEFFASLNR